MHPAPHGGELTSVRSTFLQKSSGRPGSKYELVQKLGEGAFGVAHEVLDKCTGQLRVLKTINKRQSQVPPAQLEREILNLKACDHPHIIRLFEYYEDYENIYLIMERAAGGELHQVIQEQRKKSLHLPERWVVVAIRQCLQAIAYVHSMGIIHKDLKSENILLLHVAEINDPASQPHAVIIDLGIADVFSARLGRRARCTIVAGTPTHMAPEVWCGNFGPVADVWSLGVVLFELLSGELPFLCSSVTSPSEWVRLHRQGPHWILLSHSSAQARALTQRMLNSDERMRPTAQQCLGHSWFKEDALVETMDENAHVVVPRTSPRSTAEGVGQRLEKSLHAYRGRSKFEKTVLLQVASQLHTGQIGRVADVFQTADHDRSGTLQSSELVFALRQLGVEQSDAESYASCLDVDTNGSIEYTEFAAGCIGLLYESLRGLLWQSFCVFDVDGNGVLGRDEVYAVVTRVELQKHGFLAAGRSVEEVLSRMDVDANGLISFEELCRHFLPTRPTLPTDRTSRQPAGDNGGACELPADSFKERRASSLQGKKQMTLRDEDFAQLLDEIEAGSPAHGHTFGSVGNATQQTLGGHAQHMPFAGISSISPSFTQNEEALIRRPSTGEDAAFTDEDLSRMLADMASGQL